MNSIGSGMQYICTLRTETHAELKLLRCANVIREKTKKTYLISIPNYNEFRLLDFEMFNSLLYKIKCWFLLRSLFNQSGVRIL